MTRGKPFKPSAAAEAEFARALKKIARVSGHIVDAHVVGHQLERAAEMQKALRDYSELIDPWARRQAVKMLEKVSRSTRTAMQRATAKRLQSRQAKEIGRLLRSTVEKSEVGAKAAELMHEQVTLIKSIPLKAGERAQRLALEAIYNGGRASEVAEALKRSTAVSESSALLIARTEVARANASITEARAKSIGATGYIWRTTMDGAERESHAEMNGKRVQYANPPTLSDGMTGHAGTFPNCRCFQDVQFDET